MKWLDNTNINSDFLMYGLLIGTLSLASFGVYSYFSNKINNTLHLDNSTQTLPNNLDNSTQTYIELVDKEIQSLSTSQHNIDVQTMSNLQNSSVQTENLLADVGENAQYFTDGIFIPWNTNLKDAMQEILYGMNSESTSITNIHPSVFAELVKQNEKASLKLLEIQRWVDNVPHSVSSSNGLYNSEINFLKEVLQTLNTTPPSPIVETIGNNPIISNSVSYLIENANHIPYTGYNVLLEGLFF